MLTSKPLEPHAAQKPSSTTPTNTSVLNQEEVLKFYIGLKLLGEKKQKRVLEYMRSLQEKGSTQ